MIVLLLATAADAPRPAWWAQLSAWTYQSCRAFLRHNTVAHATRAAANGAPLRLLKLGSCWGGFDCANPSYYAPAHFRAFRDFMRAAEAGTLGMVTGSPRADGRADDTAPAAAPTAAPTLRGAEATLAWDSLLEGTYSVLRDAACPASGLVPNWFVPTQAAALAEADAARARAQWPGWAPGRASCSGSGTPATEFGAEASRTVWRVALDALWYGAPAAQSFCRAVAASATPRLLARNASATASAGGATGDAPPGCPGLVEGVADGWLSRGYMLGPLAAALLVPPAGAPDTAGRQQAALDVAAAALDALRVDELSLIHI